MNSQIGRLSAFPRQFDSNWAHVFPEPTLQHHEQQLAQVPKTHTSPILTRTRNPRHGSHAGPQRPSSSGGEHHVLPYRSHAPARRAESYSHPTPLEEFRTSRRWPPKGYRTEDHLIHSEAEELICTGTSTFKGYWDEIPNTPAGYNRFYAVMEAEHQGRTDRAAFRHDSYHKLSLNITGASDSQFPWLSLEQPSMAHAFGKSPGTITLNYWVGKSAECNPQVKPRSGVKPRKLKLLQILDRLQQLESGLEEDVELLYRYLYSTLIEDPARYSDKPHTGMDDQIQDLIMILSNPEWIDFSKINNQVVAKFFDSQQQHTKHEFFHQLLLSTELYLRIHSTSTLDKAKRKLILQLPPPIAWDLAVAQRWLENMTITKSRTSESQSTFSFELKSKRRQKDALLHFAEILKWPNMDEIEYVLEESDRNEKALEDRSADAMSWFSGIVLPGKTLPWLIMNSLIDCDRDTGDHLNQLTHMHRNAGFQYRANTYWSAESIVGKVLGAARGVNQVAGWIGPCIFSPDLKRTECLRIRQLESPDPKLQPKDVESLGVRTHPLGTIEETYPIDDYEVPMPDTEEVTDVIRIEKLSLVPTKKQPTNPAEALVPMTFDAAIYFACGGESWPMKLKYDVNFISAYSCHNGPHVLFYDYKYKPIKVDDCLVDMDDWGTQSGRISRPPSSRSSPSNPKKALTLATTSSKLAHEQVSMVLAIEALGVSDNEVFARAWCAHNGHSAIVANIKDTCMACAIREAYAACVSVVIFTEGGKHTEKDDDDHDDSDH